MKGFQKKVSLTDRLTDKVIHGGVQLLKKELKILSTLDGK